MSDDTPSPELLQVDPDLMRRVAWGMLAGKTKAEIAAAEEISLEDCRIVCTTPGMFSIVNVWACFLQRRDLAGRRNVRRLTGWAVDHVLEHAPERLAESETWRLGRLSSILVHFGFAIVFGWMLAFLDGVMGLPGSRRKDLGDFRQNLVDLLCWAVEVAFRQKMIEQFPVEDLIAKDGAFQAAISEREYFELVTSLGTQKAEDAAAKSAERPSEAVPYAGQADGVSVQPEQQEPTMVPKPVMTRTRPRRPRFSLSCSAPEATIHQGVASRRKPCPRRMKSRRVRAVGRRSISARASARPRAIHSAPIRPPPLSMAGRSRPQPLVRPRPIELAA